MIVRISDEMGTAARIADEDSDAAPVDEVISQLNGEVLQGAIYSFIKDKDLENPRMAAGIHKEFATMLGVKPEQIREAFRGRPHSLAINFAAAGPKDFAAHYTARARDAAMQSFPPALFVGLGFPGVIGGVALTTPPHPNALEHPLLLILSLGGLIAISGFFLLCAGADIVSLIKMKERLDERQPGYREQIKAFVLRSGAPKNTNSCGYCASALSGAQCVNCGAPARSRSEGFEMPELAA